MYNTNRGPLMLHISLLNALKADVNRLIESQNTILLHRCRDADYEHGQRSALIKVLHILLNKEQYFKDNPEAESVPTYGFKEEPLNVNQAQSYKIEI